MDQALCVEAACHLWRRLTRVAICLKDATMFRENYSLYGIGVDDVGATCH